jgi:hypothetical protein
MPYQADFICTYKQMYDEDDQHLLYQIQLLQAFGLHSFSGQDIEDEMSELISTLMSKSPESKLFMTTVFTKLQNTTDSHIKMIIDVCNQSEHTSGNMSDILITLLFRFECFDLFHKCLCELFQSGNIKPASLEALLKQIE